MSILNEDALRRHFPSAGKTPRIATDGECLIVKNVLFNDGKRYDVKIWRFDDSGKPIGVTERDQFFTDTIIQVSDFAKKMFADIPDFQNKKIWFTDVDTMSCKIEDLEEDEGSRYRFNEIYSGDFGALQECEYDIPKYAADIHSIFFNRNETNLYSAGNPTISPTFEFSSNSISKRKELSSNDETPPPSPKPRKRKAPTTTTTMEIPKSRPSAPPAAADAPTTETPPAPATQDPIAASFEKVKSTAPFLNGITYAGLQAYSQGINQNELYVEPYNRFLNLLNFPGSDDVNDRAMLEWLQELYRAAHKANLESDFDFVEAGSTPERSAAIAVVNFIKHGSLSGDALVEKLMETPLN